MSRPQKIIPPIKGSFNSILASVAMGSGNASQPIKKLEASYYNEAGKGNWGVFYHLPLRFEVVKKFFE